MTKELSRHNFFCLRCGTFKSVTTSHKKQRYCSISCSKKLSGHHHWKGGKCLTQQGYILISTGEGSILEHIAVAEKALGHKLPKGAEVHHVNEDKSDNANTNLVICEDKGYHRILHIRQSLLREGIDPKTHKRCSTCKAIKERSGFHRSRNTGDGLMGYCKVCNCARSSENRRRGGCHGLRVVEV